MHIRCWYMLTLTFANFYFQTSHTLRQLRLPASRRFLLLRTNTINQRACTCATTFSCSCCETVTLSFTKMRKALCSNFMNQRNGMNVDVSLDTDTLRSLTVTNYRPFRLCTAIPGSLFSSICVNVVELNEFPRSITVCVRHEIVSKFEEWQINYTCVSISTDLPMIAGNASMASTMSMSGMLPASSASMMATSSSMTPQASTMSQMMVTTAAVSMMTSPAGMMMMMAPNGMGSSPPGQMGGMGGGGSPGGGSGPPPRMMSAEGNRKKRYTQIKQLLNHWSKIVSDEFRTSPLELENLTRPTPRGVDRTSVTIPKISTRVVSSGETDAYTKASILGDMTIDYDQRPGTLESAVLHDRAVYFPSRIPPAVIAMSLKQENIINPGRDNIRFITDNDNQLTQNKTGIVIFPN